MMSRITWLIAGDVLTLGLVTIFGFATHGTLGSAGMRMLTTFIPVLIAWLLIAPFVGAYNLEWTADVRQLWRPFWAMVLAAPFAAWLRGAWLGTAIMPMFVVVLGGVSALAILCWRLLYWLFRKRSMATHG